MNYSIMDEETLASAVISDDETTRLEFNLQGMVMEVDLDSGKLLRVISSNPRDYLLYQPGLEVGFELQVK
ncbi:MAG: YlzJ-like family protein [Bacillota bacterium]